MSTCDYGKDGGLYQTCSEQRERGRFFKSVSDSVMKRPKGLRGDVCRTVMPAYDAYKKAQKESVQKAEFITSGTLC